MNRHRVLGAAIVWLAVVASASALVWVVISRAGADLVASDQPVLSAGTGTAVPPRTPPARPSRTPSTSPSRTPSRPPTPAQAPTATSGPTERTPTSSSSTPTTPSASPSVAPPSVPPSSPPSQPSVTAIQERRTWQGQAGSIVVAFDASGIRLVSAQPVNGFRADVHREDDLIDVEFEGREDESGIKVSVVARCVAGVPSFSAQSKDD